MKIIQTPDGIVVEFAKQTHSRVDVLLYLKAFGSLLISLVSIFSIPTLLQEAGDATGEILFAICVGTVSFIVFNRYISKATAKESLVITPANLSIVNTAILQTTTTLYEIDRIANMQFRGKQHMKDHPLKGESFDYLGFQTQQEMINTIHDDGNLSFEYDGKTVFFGKSVPSWDAEELDEAIRQLTDNKLHIANLPENIEESEVSS